MFAFPFPNVSKFLMAAKHGCFTISDPKLPIEKNTGFQTYSIAGANKIEPLIIPLKQYSSQSEFNSIEINYGPKWMKEHRNALQTAYGKSPFFEFYDYKLFKLYSDEIQYLADFNYNSIQWLLEMFQLDIPIVIDTESQNPQSEITPYPYPQVFEGKFGFRPFISSLDLLFNQGPLSLDYLKQTI